MLDFGILSMNERNLNYIKKLNPKSSINLADNKIDTKIFLENRGVGVPKTIAIISNKKQLSSFDLKSIKEEFFVVKPVFGSKGQGILIVKNLKNGKFKIGDEIVDENFLVVHMLNILNGDFSINYGYDKILIEEKLIPGNTFEKFCEHGLADIRIIVYNLVPVMAMIRMPTKLSGGKANLAQGGIGLGLEVGSGIVKTFYEKGKIYTKNLEEPYTDFLGYELPFWNDILLASSKAQFFVNLGYLALDWVITDNGPKILEINARAGLEIQNVCLIPLKKRLDKIKDLKVSDPEKGVELSKTLFSEKIVSSIHKSKILYLSQNAEIISESFSEEIVLKIDISKNNNFISKDLYDEINKKNFIIKINNKIVFENIRFQIDDSLNRDTIIVGKNILKDYFIKPEENLKKNEIFLPKKVNKNELNILKIIDEKVSSLDRKVSITKALKPTNFLQELDRFVELKGDYNPIFTYDFLKEDRFKELEEDIKVLKETYFKKELELKSEFSNLFFDKIEEINNKLNLIKSYKNEKYDKIKEYNKRLFGDIDYDLFKKSEKKLGVLTNEKVLGKILDLDYVVSYIQNYLEKNNLSNGVKVVLSTSNISRILINRRKSKIEVRVSADGIFREEELDGIIAHEIGIHLVRYLNGRKTGWNILESGTANYIETEEGLAVYNSLKYFPENYEKNAMYQNYYLIEMSKNLDFKDLAEICFKLKGNDYVKVFKTTTRFKKGILNTSIKNTGAFFSKDKVYLDGYIKVKNWIEKGGNIEKLMIGKIKLDDLKYIY
ncbi:MAG: DUF1704 domain-containing protein [Candidatus Gracilibacteria bacterium]|nr:DUF1704 domain-containing protein [Candidatus Gracilibacteria bacterium]